MKERIIIDEDFYVKHFQEREIEFQEEDMCSGGNPEEWWHYKKEQVPETFEELKELCKGIKDCEVKDNSVIFHFKHKNRHDFKLAEFKQEGDLYIAEKIIGSVDCVKIGSNLSVKQMYQFLILFKNIRDKEYEVK